MPSDDADVIVVGGGPGGAATAYYLARHGARVLVLEKSRYPRPKVCGDGLTPRSVKQLHDMGIDTSGPEWTRNRGLRVVAGDIRLEMDWPQVSGFPAYGLTRSRDDLDHLLIRTATAAGARLETGTTVTGPIVDERTSRVVGVKAVRTDEKQPLVFRAPIVVAADGVAGRLPLALGLSKRDDRPLGVAVRRYYRSPRHRDDYLESWLELRGRDDADQLLPGYGWIFGMGDGRVNVGLGVLNSSVDFGRIRYRDMLLDWMAATPPEWGLTEDNADGPIMGAALPMGFNRVPHYTRGVLLVGDSGGMVNPFNGEGIAYAMEAGALAAEAAAAALGAPDADSRERALQRYPAELKARLGGYYRLGGWFVKLIGRRGVMRFVTKHGLPHAGLMRRLLRLMSNLTEERGGPTDRLIRALCRAVPSV